MKSVPGLVPLSGYLVVCLASQIVLTPAVQIQTPERSEGAWPN